MNTIVIFQQFNELYTIDKYKIRIADTLNLSDFQLSGMRGDTINAFCVIFSSFYLINNINEMTQIALIMSLQTQSCKLLIKFNSRFNSKFNVT